MMYVKWLIHYNASGKRQKVESNPTTTPGRVLTRLQRTTLILGEPAISHAAKKKSTKRKTFVTVPKRD